MFTKINVDDESMFNAAVNPVWRVLIYNGALMVVKLFNIVVPDTCNELLMVVILFNVVIPETFNELLIVH